MKETKRLTLATLAGVVCAGLLAPTVVFAGAAGGGIDAPGVYFEPDGVFSLRTTLDTGPADITAFIAAQTGWVQVSGDWDGDGVDGIGIYSLTTGTWFLVNTAVDSPGSPLPADYSIFMSADGADWIPITGNWDGIGGDGIGIYNRMSGTMFLVNDPTQGVQSGAALADYVIFMSADGPDWIPMTGNWDGTGGDGVGIYNKMSGTMFLANDATQGVQSGAAPADYQIFMSADGPAWTPVAGNWNGEAGDGVGIWSQDSGAFFLANDATQGTQSGAAPADLSLFIVGKSGAGYGPLTGAWTD